MAIKVVYILIIHMNQEQKRSPYGAYGIRDMQSTGFPVLR